MNAINDIIAVRFLSKPWVLLENLREARLNITPWLHRNNIDYIIKKKFAYFTLPERFLGYTEITTKNIGCIDMHKDHFAMTLMLFKLHNASLTYFEHQLLFSVFQYSLPSLRIKQPADPLDVLLKW